MGGTANPCLVPVHAISTAVADGLFTGTVVLVYQLCPRWFGCDRLDGMMTIARVFTTLVMVFVSQYAALFSGGKCEVGWLGFDHHAG